MNAIKILGHLMNLPASDRDMVIDLAKTMSDSLQKKRAVSSQKKQVRKGVRPYLPDERKWLNDLFVEIENGTKDADASFREASKRLRRSTGAIERKWLDFNEGKSDIGSWDDWVGN